MPLPANESGLKVGRTQGGYRVRVEGRGTMRQSRVAHAFVLQCLTEEGCSVSVDLSGCEYLDSTFQGCLLDLQKTVGRGPDSRFSVANPSEKVRRLLTTAHVDRYLNIVHTVPPVLGEEVIIPPETLDSDDLSRHIMESHRRLAETGGPQQAAFRKIADQIELDLQKQTPARPA